MEGSMNFTKLFVGAFALSAMLVACGDDSTSAKDTDRSEEVYSDLVVETFDDLPVCSDNRDGVTAYVKDEKTAYICTDGSWVPEEETSSSSIASTSSSSWQALSSSLRNDNSSSSSETTQSSSSFVYEQNSSAYDQPEVVAVNNKTVSGVSQKGPFVTGSAVKLYELDGTTYAQTGKSFTGKIASDDGKFSVASVTLASQYALLEANGYFRNEVSGTKSSGTITLNALTDLSDREKVNINLLTHLEYERALYLIGTGINVPSAKKQAEAEIFNAFGIQGEFANSEDLDIFSSGDGNAALLAFSVLMLRNLSEADLTELLTKFATDIEKDGSWDDEATKTNIADWAQETDLAGDLAAIRSNVEGWNLGTVPDFEKYVRNFWYTNYGLGDCDKGREGEVIATQNELSTTYGSQMRFICKSGAWVEASDIEKDTYRWEAGEDGEIKTGDVTEKKYDYDAKLKQWRAATTVEAALGGCTETREADISLNTGKVNGTWYICKSREWVSTNNITVDTQGWIKGSDGDLQKGDSTDVIYKYDEALGEWVTANHNDTTLGLMGCTTNRTGEIGKSSSNDIYYVCKSMIWQTAQEIDYDTYGEKCTSAEVGTIITGKVTETNKYYCSETGWISLMGWSWDIPKEARLNPEITYGSMTDSRDGKSYKTVIIGTQTWMAENLNYADSVTTASLKGKSLCFKNVAKNCDLAGRLYTWAAAIDSVKLANDVMNPLDCGYGKTCGLSGTVQGICPSGWHLPSRDEWDTLITAVGGSSTAGTVLKSQTGWTAYVGITNEDAFGFSALPAGERTNYGGYSLGGSEAYFWSSTENGSSDAYRMYLYSYKDNAYLSDIDKNYGHSVRCVKD